MGYLPFCSLRMEALCYACSLPRHDRCVRAPATLSVTNAMETNAEVVATMRAARRCRAEHLTTVRLLPGRQAALRLLCLYPHLRRLVAGLSRETTCGRR